MRDLGFPAIIQSIPGYVVQLGVLKSHEPGHCKKNFISIK